MLNPSTSAVPSAPAVPRIAWVLCGFLFLATALSFLDRQVLSVLAPSLTKDLRMDNTDYSRVVSAFVMAYTIMFAAGGWLVDRLGTVRGLALSVGSLVPRQCGPFVSRRGGWPWCRPLHSGAGGGRLFSRRHQGCRGMVSPAQTRPGHRPCHWRLGFRFRAGAPAHRVDGRQFRLARRVPGHRHLRRPLGGGVAVRRTLCARNRRALTSRSERTPKPPGREVFRQPAISRILLARFLFDPVFYFYMFWIPQYLSREREFSLEHIGKYYWIPFFALGVSNILSGRLGDTLLRLGWPARRARRTLLAISALVTPVSCLVIFTPSAAWAIALMALLMAAHGLWICNYLALISDHFPARVMATAVGLTGTVGGCAGILANLVTGPVVDAHGFTPIFLGTALLYPLALVVLLTIPRTSTLLERCTTPPPVMSKA